MLKIMIVDDRPVFLTYLKTAIEWENYGFTICCEAKNGEEALNLAHVHLPDIVLTDINMPIMDGLMLTEELVKIYPEVSIVLITGYSDFEYARKAIRLGVSDYILKPFEKEEMILTLLKIKDNLKVTFEKGKTLDSKESLFDQYFRELIHSKEIYIEPIVHKTRAYDINLAHYAYIAVVTAFSKEFNPEDFIYWKDTVMLLMKQMFELDYFHQVFEDYEGRIVSIVGIPRLIEDMSKDYLAIKGEYEKIIGLLKKHIQSGVVSGISTSHLAIKGIRLSYLEAISALQHASISTENILTEFTQIPEENKQFRFYSSEINDLLLMKLRDNDEEGALKVIDDIFNKYTNTEMSAHYTYLVYAGLVSIVLSHITQSGKRIDNVLGEQLNSVTSISDNDNIYDQTRSLKRIISVTINHFRKFKITRSAKVAEKAKAYIDAHFMDHTLSVKDIATNQYINETYLRSMFKQELGCTITEYITQIRMNEALNLLKSSGLKLSEISSLIGYNDAAYFSRAFKKYYGVSPSHYLS